MLSWAVFSIAFDSQCAVVIGRDVCWRRACPSESRFKIGFCVSLSQRRSWKCLGACWSTCKVMRWRCAWYFMHNIKLLTEYKFSNIATIVCTHTSVFYIHRWCLHVLPTGGWHDIVTCAFFLFQRYFFAWYLSEFDLLTSCLKLSNVYGTSE